MNWSDDVVNTKDRASKFKEEEIVYHWFFR